MAGVPVVFAAGDKALVDQLRGLLGPIEAVAVKEEIRDAVLSMSPKTAQDEIRRGVEEAVRNRAKFKPFTLPGPYTMIAGRSASVQVRINAQPCPSRDPTRGRSRGFLEPPPGPVRQRPQQRGVDDGEERRRRRNAERERDDGSSGKGRLLPEAAPGNRDLAHDEGVYSRLGKRFFVGLAPADASIGV